jgi:hypothetical protein
MHLVDAFAIAFIGIYAIRMPTPILHLFVHLEIQKCPKMDYLSSAFVLDK